VTKMLVLI